MDRDGRRRLTLFVPTVFEGLAGALDAALGADFSARFLAADQTPDGAWRVAFAVGRGGTTVNVELSAPSPRAQGWWRGESVLLGYRRGDDGVDPFSDPERAALLNALRDRLRAHDAGGDAALGAFVARAAEAHGYRALRDDVYRYVAPREALIRLGFRCNQRCDFCWQERDWPDAPDALYRRWVDEVAAQGVQEIHFSGGEPTLHRALPDLVRRAAQDHGMSVWLQTNALRLAKPDYLALLRDAGLRGVFVSYHSHRPEVSDAMTRAPGTHALTERGIAACLDAGLAVVLNTVVERRNHQDLPAMAAHIVEAFCRGGRRPKLASFSHPGSYLLREDFDAGLVALDLVGPLLAEAVRTLARAGIPSETGGTCGFPSCVFAGDPDLVRPTPQSSYDVDHAPDRVFVSACEGCARRRDCVGLRRAYVERLGTRGLVPFNR